MLGLELDDLVEHEETVLVFDVSVYTGYHWSLLVHFGSAAPEGTLTLALSSIEELFDPLGVPTESI